MDHPQNLPVVLAAFLFEESLNLSELAERCKQNAVSRVDLDSSPRPIETVLSSGGWSRDCDSSVTQIDE